MRQTSQLKEEESDAPRNVAKLQLHSSDNCKCRSSNGNTSRIALKARNVMEREKGCAIAKSLL
jgi:hypothetical protein